MQVGETDEHIFADLHVSVVANVLQLHHLDESLVPLAHVVPLLLIGIETLNDVSVNHVDVEVRRANHVLHLPQVEQIFGDVLFAFLLCNNHDVPWVVYPNLLMFRSMVSFTILMRRPSTVRMRSWTNDDSVRMALDVVMFERLAMSSRAM